MHIFVHTAIFFLFITCSLLVSAGAAESFPFRAIEPGDILPGSTVQDNASGKKISLDSLGVQHTVLFFWGGDLPGKKQRAISALNQLQELARFFQERKVQLLVINAQGDPPEISREVAVATGFASPMYTDPEQSAYGALGIFVLPAVLLVDQQGRAVNGFGYGKDMVASLKGEIEILLQEKTRPQVEAELRPQMAEASRETKDGQRHLGLGHAMRSKGQPEAAAREYALAIESNPGLAEAHIALGCIFIDLSRLPEAEKSLAQGMKLQPDALQGEICAARLKAEQGQVAAAIADLQAMLFRNGRDPGLRFVLGTLHAKKGDHEKAAQEFRRAYEFLEKTSHSQE